MPLSAILQSYVCWRSYAQSYDAYRAVGNMDRFFVSLMGDALGPEHVYFGRPAKTGGGYGQ